MGTSCPEGFYWDGLLKHCMDCLLICEKSPVPRCISYCESASCKAQPGHHYDGLLRKCLMCSQICGKHPAECAQHCPTPTPPVTTKKLLVEAAVESNVLHYSLLALCVVLLFSSLSLTLVIFLKRSKSKSSNPGPKKANYKPEHTCIVQPGEEVGLPSTQLAQTLKDSLKKSSFPTDQELLDDSSPTETCVCVHCFPDLKALGQGNERSLRAPFSSYQQTSLPTTQIQKGGSLWTEASLHTSVLGIQEEAAVR